MIEINLIPDVKQELIKAETVRSNVISVSIVVGIGALAVVALLVAYVFAVQSIRSAVADEAIKTENAKLAAIPDLSKTLTIQNQLGLISELNSQKKINSRIFDVLSSVLPPSPNTVQVSNLAINSETTRITLEGQTRSYDSLEVFKKTVDGAMLTYTVDDAEQQVKLATEISTSDVSFGQDSTGARVVRFTLGFTYPVELFSPTIPSIVIKLTNQGNVTDSYLGIPKSIFVERADDLDEEVQ